MAKESTVIGTGLLIGLAGVVIMGASSISSMYKKNEPSPKTQQLAGLVMATGLTVAYLGWQKGIPLTK